MRRDVLMLLLVAHGCDSSPTGADGDCRRYITSMSENGVSFTCAFERASATLRCSSGALLERAWEYAGVDDFISEAPVPNRIRARERISAGGTLGSFARTVTEYRYDDQGRLLERVRIGESSIGSQALDTVRYTAWDGLGRPTAGTLTSAAESEILTLRYDDALLRVDVSNGESTLQDGNGNPLREVLVFGAGSTKSRFERDYQIPALSEICRDP